MRVLWITVPRPTGDLGPLAIALAVLVSFVPCLCGLAALVYFCALASRGWPEASPTATDDALQDWCEEARRQLRHMCVSLRVVAFLAASFGLTALQHQLFRVPRPMGSCLSSNGLPSGEALSSTGLLTMCFLDTALRGFVRHLACRPSRRRRGDEQPPAYSEVLLERLGFHPLGSGEIFARPMLALLVFGPVPWARQTLGDATYAQSIVGAAEGCFLGVALHVLFVASFGAGQGGRCQRWQQGLLIPLLQRCGRRGRRLKQMQALTALSVEAASARAGSQGASPSRQSLVEDRSFAVAGSCDDMLGWCALGASSPRHDHDTQLRMPHDRLPPEVAQGKILWRLANGSAGDETCPRWCATLGRMPGLEFLTVQPDDIFALLAEQERELKDMASTNATLVDTVRALSQQQDMFIKFREESAIKMQQHELDFKERQERHRNAMLQAALQLQEAHEHAQQARQEAKEREAECERLRVEFAERRTHMLRELDRKRDEHVEALARAHREGEEAKAVALQQLRLEFDHAKAVQKEQLDNARREAAEAERQAAREIAMARREGATKLLDEKRRQTDFVSNLIIFAQALTALLDAGKNGDRKALEAEHKNVGVLKHKLEEEAIRRLAEPILEQAVQTSAAWVGCIQDLSDALDKAKSYTGEDSDKVTQLARQLFGAVASAVDKGVCLAKHDAHVCEESERWLIERWLPSIAKHHADRDVQLDVFKLQRRIIFKAVWSSKEDLGGFAFADLEACLETVDCGQRSFLASAEAQVEHKPPRTLVRALSQLSALVYFMNYLESEDLSKTKEVFKQYLARLDGPSGAEVARWVDLAYHQYREDSALLRRQDFWGIRDKNPTDVIEIISGRGCPELGKFHSIFCSLARSWERDFKVLAVPHHAQVFALLVFKAFLEDPQERVRTLLAQVSTGEGKSILIAVLAVFICCSAGKRVHVVGSDKRLVLRDFENFRSLFRAFASEVDPAIPPERFAVVCGEHQPNGPDDMVQSIPDDAWIVYCEARHVTSLYTQKARRGELSKGMYDNHVLVLDEVDALVVDQEPTEDFVYDVGWRTLGRGATVGQYATQLGRHLAKSQDYPPELKPCSETEKQIDAQLKQLFREVQLWRMKPKQERDAEFQLCVGELDHQGISRRYVRVENGKINPHYHSNFLECLRLSEDLDALGYQMKWYERLFVMSKPRVFRQYSRILGLSGTVGNEREQAFLQKAYGAQFFIVPPFLETCSGVEVRSAQWAGQEHLVTQGKVQQVCLHSTLPGPGVVLANAEDQYKAVEALAFEVRKLVPVLVIAPTPERADALVDRLRQRARSMLAGCNTTDLVRSLSQREYDRSPQLYKESLRASTRTLSRNVRGPKEFRITVTDYTGARGTDYQMVDEDADRLGGLMLIVMHVPPSKREWIQYRGRTARQNWRGQYCVVLNVEDYRALDHGSEEALPPQAYQLRPGDPPFAPSDPDAALIQRILEFGSKESARRLEECRTVYNSGFIANEVCERVWTCPGWRTIQEQPNGRVKVDVALSGQGRKLFLDICSRYRYMSAGEIAQAAGAIEGPPEAPGRLEFALVDSEVPDKHYEKLRLQPQMVRTQKALLFLMDVSGSMSVNKIGPWMTRLEACKARVKSLIMNDSIVSNGDLVGIVAFGAGHRQLLPRSHLPSSNSGRQLHGSGHQLSASAGTVPIVGPVIRKHVTALVEDNELELAQASTEKEYGPELRVYDRNGIDLKNKKLGNFTFLYSTLCSYVGEFVNSRYGGSSRWVILLCDGDDSGGGRSEDACRELLEGCVGKLNLVIISVGSDVTSGSVLQSFADTVTRSGGVGKYIAAAQEDDDRALQNAFEQVEESLLLDGGGQVEVGGN